MMIFPAAALICLAAGALARADEPASDLTQLSARPPLVYQEPLPSGTDHLTDTGIFSFFHMALMSEAYPTADEQYFLELVNRARANPAAEAARLGIDLNEGLPAGTITNDPKQPLAFNLHIVSAAQLHSQWMIDTDTFSHTGEGGSDPMDRMLDAGYVFVYPGYGWSWAENIAYTYASWVLPVTATTADHYEALFIDEGIAGRGHRTNMMTYWLKETGVGVRTGDWAGYNAVNVTQDFALAGGFVFLTGVAYDDSVTNDDFYTPGEGLAGVTVTATRASDSAQFTTTTWASGGYTLSVPAGTYTVTATSTDLGGTVTVNNVAVGSQNVKVDFTPLPFGPDFVIDATTSSSFTYQNAPNSTGNAHHAVLTISVLLDIHGNSSYTSDVAVASSSTGNVILEPTADPLVWNLRGSRFRVDPFGPVTLDVTVHGADVGGYDSTAVQFKVRPLGDIDGNASVTTADFVELTKRLNNIIAGTDLYDLDGNGSVTTADSVLLTKILNNLTVD